MRFLRFKPRRSIVEAAKVGASAEEEELEGRQGLLPHTPTSTQYSEQAAVTIDLPNLRTLHLHQAPPPSSVTSARQQEQAACATKIVTLKAFIHCHGCARRLKKTLSKLQGVNTYHVDTDQHKVTVIGCLCEDEVLQCVNKVIKGTQLWTASNDTSASPTVVAS